MNKYILYIILPFLLLACNHKQKQKKPELILYCASSLTNVLSEISNEFETETGIKVKLNFASSGTLARQIEHGANPSLFISANKKWLTYLNETGKLNSEFEKKIAGNSLVIIAPLHSKLDSSSFEDALDILNTFSGRLSLGDPKHVPAGEYAMQAIKKFGLDNKISGRLLPAKDVRSALMVVELGESELGIVYKTDAFKSEKVKILKEIPTSFHAPISYYLSVLNSKDEKAKLFYAYLSSETSNNIWLKNGFKIE